MSERRERWRQPEKHEPRWQYDCINCKFNWCCGYLCYCNLMHTHKEPPMVIQELVDEELKANGYEPQFKPCDKRNIKAKEE